MITIIIIIIENLQNCMHEHEIKMPHSLVTKILVRFSSCKPDLNARYYPRRLCCSQDFRH